METSINYLHMNIENCYHRLGRPLRLLLYDLDEVPRYPPGGLIRNWKYRGHDLIMISTSFKWSRQLAVLLKDDPAPTHTRTRSSKPHWICRKILDGTWPGIGNPNDVEANIGLSIGESMQILTISLAHGETEVLVMMEWDLRRRALWQSIGGLLRYDHIQS